MKRYFENKVDLRPNFIFPCTIFDPAVRRENNLATPLVNKIKPHYDTPGAYVFFEPCNQDNRIEVMYIGRSATLRNRINGHWGNYTRNYENSQSIISQWFDYCWKGNFPFCPYIAIFISYGNLRDLEHWLMQLKPKFNIY